MPVALFSVHSISQRDKFLFHFTIATTEHKTVEALLRNGFFYLVAEIQVIIGSKEIPHANIHCVSNFNQLYRFPIKHNLRSHTVRLPPVNRNEIDKIDLISFVFDGKQPINNKLNKNTKTTKATKRNGKRISKMLEISIVTENL